MRTAHLFVTHVWTPEIEEEFAKIRCDSAPGSDSWLLLDARTSGLCELVKHHRCHVFDIADLAQLPYSMLPRQSLIGHGHLPILDFFLAHPDYDAYWFIEYDVKYTGAWSDLFTRYESHDSDFITMHIRPFAAEPLWPHWSTFRQSANRLALMPGEWLRSFNVFYRISRSALEFLDSILRDRWCGHHEVLIVTLLRKFGFSLLDFGGDGPFTQPGRTNAVYTSHGSRSGYLNPFRTVRYRPSRLAPGGRPGMIYHPVKPAHLREPFSERWTVYKHWFLEEEKSSAGISGQRDGVTGLAPVVKAAKGSRPSK
jgi:hypothetical protein